MKILFLLLPLLVFSKEIDLIWLLSKPEGIVKDYYIWRYLHQDINCSQATQALQQARYVNKKLFYAYARHCPGPIEKIATCMRKSAKELLLKEDPSCAAAGITSYKLSTLSKKEVKRFLKKIEQFSYPKNYHLFLKSKLSPREFITLFNQSSTPYRKKLDRFLLKKDLKKIVHHWRFPSFVKRVVFSHNYKKLSHSLLYTPPYNVNSTTAFYLAMNALRHNKKRLALHFLHRAQKSSSQETRDKVAFWIYHLTKNKKVLKKVASSHSINIYSLLAKEKLHKEISFLIPEANKIKKDINLSDPFLWSAFLKEKSPKENYYYKNTLPLYSILLEKESRYRVHPFIFPYQELLRDSNISRKSLIYAIARQESRFIPGAVSRSYALGLMQFMPFLAKATAKKMGLKNFDLDMMFDPQIAIVFAQDHLDYLEKKLHTPLFIAYAYNGGIGFTKRLALPLFCNYDPILAMELVPYSESREYGKRVLANYYVYRKILKKPFSIWSYFENLQNMSHNFCSKK